ncbi:MAG: hypothetical protein HAW58_03325 [Candidatus Thioglobus sp.]|nr:hypothetical protein [Candidatus Thioglobus sp.]
MVAALVTSISITSVDNIFDGERLTLAANVEPAEAAQTVNWTITAGSQFASINGNILTGTAPGRVTIRASATDSSGRFATQQFTVKPTPITSFTIGGPNSFADGTSITLSATVLPATASNQTISWSIFSGGNFATLGGANGNVLTATAPGVVSITGTTTDGTNLSVTKQFTVNAVPISTITIGALRTVENGSSIPLTATVLPANASDKSVSWAISGGNNAIASINGSTFFGITPGTVSVIASSVDSGNATASADFIVTAVQVASIDITSTNNLRDGQTQTLTATALPAEASDKTIAWTIKTGGGQAVGIVSISGNVITALRPGAATIIATATDRGTITKEQRFTVFPQPVASILITSAGSVVNGESLTLTHSVTPATATNQTVSWRISSGGNFASLSGNILTGTAVGGPVVVVATAADGRGATQSKNITVQAAAAVSVSIDSAAEVFDGRSINLSATVSPSGANQAVVWSISAGGQFANLSGNTLSGTAPGTVTGEFH